MRVFVAALLAAVTAGLVLGTAQAGTKVAPAERRAINRVLDVFVPAALARRHSARAWALATPAMHRGGTRAGWARGDLPLMPFPAAGTRFHGWTVDTARPSTVELVLLVHPRKGARAGAVSFDVRMRKLHGRWLVDSFAPAAFFAPPGSDSGIVAQPDLAPGPAVPPYAKQGRIGSGWLFVIGGALLGTIALAPVVIVAAHRARDRRAARRHGSAPRRVRTRGV